MAAVLVGQQHEIAYSNGFEFSVTRLIRPGAPGFDEHLTKPVKIERLQALLNHPR